MAERPDRSRTLGFSLVEMLVATMFVLILMAGMAAVFKASLTTSYTQGEVLASTRRNRMSIDVLGNDLNTVEMYLDDLSQPPMLSAGNPPFYILPNMPIANAGPNDPQTSDELYFYLDQALPFEGTLEPGGTAQSANQLVVSGGNAAAAGNTTYVIDCPNQNYANSLIAMVTANLADPNNPKPLTFTFKDYFDNFAIKGIPVAGAPLGNGKVPVTVVGTQTPTAAVTGMGSSGLPTKTPHLAGSGILFASPAQMVRYRVEMQQLDPMSPTGMIPCLMRDQGPYNYGGGFVASQTPQIITENVGRGNDPNQSGFKVYLSVDSGQHWAGLNFAGTGFTNGWDGGIRATLDAQLAITGRPDANTTRKSDSWLRDIPTLVRVDLTTRTAVQRSEYNTTNYQTGVYTPNVTAYKNFTQSLVFVPVHSGLPISEN